jgi:streptogramin lyase
VSGKLRLVIAVAAALVVLTLTPGASSAATPEYFPVPESRGVNTGIVADPEGNVWFAVNGPASNSISELGRLTPTLASPGTSAGISYFKTPAYSEEGCCVSLIRDLDFDPDKGRIWFTRSVGAVGYGNVASMSPGTSSGVQVAKTPGAPNLGDIAVDSTGTAWFTEVSSNNVGPAYAGNRIAHTDGSLVIGEYPDLWHQTGVPENPSRYDARPAGVTIGAKDGLPWFAESNAGFPGYRLARATGGLYEEYQVKPCAPEPMTCSGSNTGTGPLSVASDLDGNIWFTNVLKNSFGKFDPLTATFTQYSLPAIDPDLVGGEPRSIRVAPDGTLWLAQFGFISYPKANAIVRIVPTDPPTVTVYKLGTGKSPLSVAPDSKGNVWFAVNGDTTGYVGRLAGVVGEGPPPPPPGGGPATAPAGKVVAKATGSGVARVNDPELRAKSLRLTQICVGPPEDRCSLVYLLDSHEYVTGFPGTKPRLATASAKRKTRKVVVGSKTVNLAGGQSTTVAINLNAKGKAILKRDGVLHLTFHATQKVTKGGKKSTKVLKTKKLTIKAP